MDRFEGFHGGWGGRQKGRKQGWVSSRDMRDSSPALPAGSPQRWQSRCKLNLVCGCWLVRSSLGSARSEEGGVAAQWRAPLFSRPQSGMQFTWCPTSATSRPVHLARLAVHPPPALSLSLSLSPPNPQVLQVLCAETKEETNALDVVLDARYATMEKAVNIEGD